MKSIQEVLEGANSSRTFYTQSVIPLPKPPIIPISTQNNHEEQEEEGKNATQMGRF